MLTSFRRWLSSRKPSATPLRKKPARYRPLLEGLEDRITPVSIHGGESSTFNLNATGIVGVVEGSIGAQTDAFDLVGELRVNGLSLAGTGSFTGQTASYSTLTIAGLLVTPQLFVAQSSATVREFVTFQNPTAAPITVPVVLSTNLGSDGGTQIVTSSNGNTTFEIDDRWIITDDANLTGDDPTVTSILFGPGAPAVTPTAVTDPVAGFSTFTATYNLTVPAGQTQSLLFFYQLNTTASHAISDAQADSGNGTFWATNPVAGNDVLAGLTDAQLATVANWQFGAGANNNLHGGEGASWNLNTFSVGIIDASLGDQQDAFDGQGLITVNGTLLTGTPTLAGNSATYPTQAVAGLNVSTELFAAPSSATMRELVTFENSTGADITVTVVLDNNLGSDGQTQIVTTSSGDTTFTNTDRFVVTDDGSLTGGDPTVTTVLFGPGSPSVTPSTVTDPAGSGTFTVTYSLTVPAGQTRRLLFFHQLNPTSTAAIVDATESIGGFWRTIPVAGNDVLAGLTDTQLATVANWEFGSVFVGNFNLHGGEGASWFIDNGNVTGATIGDQTDGFDGVGRVFVNGTLYNPFATLAGNTASYPAVAIAGLNVSTELFIAPSSSTLRELVSFQNPTAAAITVTVVLDNNLGSDGSTQIVTTSSGDTAFTIADRFLVTDDGNLAGGDPTVTTVFFGPGTPAVTPNVVTSPVGSGDYTVTYSLTVPRFASSALVFFHQINTTAAIAQRRDNQMFDGAPVIGNDLFAGLTPTQRGQIVNYNINTAPIALNDALTLDEDSGATVVAVRGNDFDADGDTLIVESVGQATNGTTAIISGGAGVSYRPNANYFGPDSFTYIINDGVSGSSTATVNVTVNELPDGPFVVSNLGDASDGNFAAVQLTLREAIALANADPGADTINFSVTGTIMLGGTQLPTITDRLTIQGPGANLLTIDGNNGSRILQIATAIIAELSGLTLTRGKILSDRGGAIHNAGILSVSSSVLSNNSAQFGGAVANLAGARLAVVNSTLSENTAVAAAEVTLAGDGGAIENFNGTLTVINSTLTNNLANNLGGAILTDGAAAAVTVINSTISGNRSDGEGGAINVYAGTLVVRNSTIVLNRADANGNGTGLGGAISITASLPSSAAKLFNTIVAGNLHGTGTIADDISILSGNLDTVSANNLIGDAATAGGLTHGNNSNILGNGAGALLPLASILNPSLANNGGPTFTHALIAGSPAVNSGNNNLALDAANVPLTTEQRGPGFPRISGGTVDRGAYERQGPTDIALAQAQLRENSAGGTVVGVLASTDLDTGDTFTYQLINNAGGRFQIGGAGGSSIVVAPGAVLDFETTPILNVTVRSTDSFGVSLDKTFSVTLTNVNDAPVNVVPGTQKVVKNRVLAFTGAKRIMATDPDAGAGIVRVTLTVTLGTLQLASTAGLKSITGNRTKRIVMTGTLTALNNVLAKLKFSPLANRIGKAKLTITTEDLGNTGPGGSLRDADTVTLTIK